MVFDSLFILLLSMQGVGGDPFSTPEVPMACLMTIVGLFYHMRFRESMKRCHTRSFCIDYGWSLCYEPDQ